MTENTQPGTPAPSGSNTSEGNATVTVPKPLLTLAVAFLLGGLGGTGVGLARPQVSVPIEVTQALGEINLRLARIDAALDASNENRKRMDATSVDHENRLRALEATAHVRVPQ